MKHILLLAILSLAGLAAWAQPDVTAKGTFTTRHGEEIEEASDGQEAPLQAHFYVETDEADNYDMRYEWKITRQGEEQELVLQRFEEEIDYTFVQSGTFVVQLYVTYTLKGDATAEPEELVPSPIIVSITESKLEMPNAFNPKSEVEGNRVYRAKPGYQSIISFRATIFNRWGQKIYSWDNLEGGWDGTWHGHIVNDGVYFVNVDAKGADGKHYRIRRDVNVLTGTPNRNNNSNNGPEE